MGSGPSRGGTLGTRPWPGGQPPNPGMMQPRTRQCCPSSQTHWTDVPAQILGPLFWGGMGTGMARTTPCTPVGMMPTVRYSCPRPCGLRPCPEYGLDPWALTCPYIAVGPLKCGHMPSPATEQVLTRQTCPSNAHVRHVPDGHMDMAAGVQMGMCWKTT